MLQSFDETMHLDAEHDLTDLLLLLRFLRSERMDVDRTQQQVFRQTGFAPSDADIVRKEISQGCLTERQIL